MTEILYSTIIYTIIYIITILCYVLNCTVNIYRDLLQNAFLHIDAEFEAVIMGNRHSPAKCIVLGKWDDPGEFRCKKFTVRSMVTWLMSLKLLMNYCMQLHVWREILY